MDSRPCSLAEVLAALARGATVVTSNQRAARTLHALHRQQQQTHGHLAVHTPELLSWESWTTSLWRKLLQSGAEERLLLNPAQERLLWREIISADDDLATLRSADSLAPLAAGAWTLLGRYGGRAQLKSLAVTADTRAFASWAARFERRCRAEKLLPAAELEDALCSALAQSSLKAPAELLLLGFERLTPAQQRLIAALQSSSTALQQLHLRHDQAERGPHRLLAAPTEQDELHAAAAWAHHLLQDEPGARIALIVPNLESDLPEIDRVLRNTLAPELHDIAATAPAPYEFSLGATLAAAPMLSTAIELLRWTLAPQPIERVSTLLLSPWLGDSGECFARAELDAFVLRQADLLRPELTLRSVLRACAGQPQLASTTQLLAAILQSASDRGLAGSRTLSYAEWMEAARHLLRAAGWPGSRTLDSTGFQLHRKWESALDQVATLDFTGNRVPFAEALAALDRTLRETRFAPQSHHAPVQVMGVLESAGSLFDAIWFLRGADSVWPPRPGPHPLLPWQLQRRFNMPGVDPAQSLQDARSVVERIRRSAPQVIFSCAHQGKDGPQLRSSVLAQLGWPEELAPPESLPQPIAPALLEPDDASLPALPPGILRGGQSILRLQAECGFRAFAEHRLRASALDSITLGMDARQRGILVHDVIRRFWAEVQTQDALRAMTEAQRRVLLTQCIDAALGSAASGSAWESAYLQSQQRRLVSLLSPWLERELARKPFAVLLSEAAFDDVAVGPLRLSLRIDRVDRVEGGEVLIDYKTGNASARSWAGPRPEEPQLPLYAAFARTQPLQAIAFARLRAGNDLKFEGYDAGNTVLPLKAVDLQQQIGEWRMVLEQLAQDFADGRADVDPRQYPKTCQTCEQHLICRIEAASFESQSSGEPEDETEQIVG